jgi:hypothetical protein
MLLQCRILMYSTSIKNPAKYQTEINKTFLSKYQASVNSEVLGTLFYIQGVSGGVVKSSGGGSMDYSE